MKRFLFAILCGLSLMGSSAIAQDKPENDDVTKDEELKAAAGKDDRDAQSNLGRYNFEDRGISMVAPRGWTLSPVNASQPVEIVAPEDKETHYRGNIKIMRFGKDVSLSATGKEELLELITKKHSYLSYIEGYRVRAGTDSELNDGTQAVLYYSDFRMNDMPMMQAHLVVPANGHHFIVTYTDAAKNFDGDKSEIFLEVVWPAMASIRVAEPSVVSNPWKDRVPSLLGLAFLVVLSVVFYRVLRRKSEERELAMNMEDDKKVSQNSSQGELDLIIEQKMQNYTSAQDELAQSKHAKDEKDDAELEDFDDEDTVAI